jgi:hypothetical protein
MAKSHYGISFRNNSLPLGCIASNGPAQLVMVTPCSVLHGYRAFRSKYMPHVGKKQRRRRLERTQASAFRPQTFP